MKRTAVLTLSLAGALAAQIPFSHSTEIRTTWNTVKGNLTRAVEAMPEDQYGFKPVPEIRSFAELATHVADAQGRLCGGAAGKAIPALPAKNTKAEVLAAVKDSIAICDAAWDSLTEANVAEKVGGGAGARSRLATLEYNTVHSNEEYGYMAVYLRLKGVVPPSSAGAGRGPGR